MTGRVVPSESRMGRRSYLALSALVLSMSLLTCQARLVDIDEPERKQWCTGVNAARVYDAEGNNAGLVKDQDGNQTWICWCVTHDEALAMESEVNEIAYQTCLESAAAMGYAEANDCEYWYSIGHWGTTMFKVWSIHQDVVCDADEPSGCSVR